MISWMIFITLNALSIIATRRFIPLEHLTNYARCRKDRVFWLANIFSHSIWVVAAIQAVAGPSYLTIRAPMVGIVSVIAGKGLVIWARRVNSLFVPAIIYVPPRLRVMCGPYRFLAHPGYLGMVLAAFGEFFLLGQSMAIFPLSAYICLILHRTGLEHRILSEKIHL
jgi:protein-S-isoprenylcysteine O-methyltransferase Ste14